jgi:carbamoylphosphate synthase large subunit
MDIAEDRGRFSDILKELEIPYPEYGTAWTVDEAIVVANKVGYPCACSSFLCTRVDKECGSLSMMMNWKKQ